MPDRGDVSKDVAAPTSLSVQKYLPANSDCTSLDQRGFYVRVGKRLIDLLLSLFGLVLAAPMLVVIAGLIKLSSPGPVLFRQHRVGKEGRLFWILKFRSMVDGADRRGNGITPGDDPRVTHLGSYLREWKLDELPQLWNVLRGEMSIVGPRPELPSYVAEYTGEQKAVLRVKPGITDPASLRYRDESRVLEESSNPETLYREKILPEKLVLNLQYLREISFTRDLRLMASTIKSVLRFSQTEH